MSKKIHLLSRFYANKASENDIAQLAHLVEQPDTWKEEMDDVWNHSFGEIPKSIDQRIQQRLDQATLPKRKRSELKFRIVPSHIVAAALLLLSFYFWNENHVLTRYHDQMVEVGRGQKSELSLPDGTKVYLNADSRLSYGTNFNGRQRCVELVGEAYFEVATDTSSPFVVLARGVEIKALGTAFNVQAYASSDQVTTYLSKGSVEICSEDYSARLKPGEIAVCSVSKSTLRRQTAEDSRFYTGWRNDELSFIDKSLPEILHILERHYNATFVIQDETLNNITFTGTLKNNSLQSTLDALQFTAPIEYRNNNNVIELYSKTTR